jgi:hypothetical protein
MHTPNFDVRDAGTHLNRIAARNSIHIINASCRWINISDQSRRVGRLNSRNAVFLVIHQATKELIDRARSMNWHV